MSGVGVGFGAAFFIVPFLSAGKAMPRTTRTRTSARETLTESEVSAAPDVTCWVRAPWGPAGSALHSLQPWAHPAGYRALSSWGPSSRRAFAHALFGGEGKEALLLNSGPGQQESDKKLPKLLEQWERHGRKHWAVEHGRVRAV